MQKEDQLTENQGVVKTYLFLISLFKSHQKAAHGDVSDAQGERVLQCAGPGQAAGAALRVCQGITGLLNCPLYATHHLLCQRPRPAY